MIDRLDAWIGPANSVDDFDCIDARGQQYAAWARRTKRGRAFQRRVRHGNKLADPAGAYYTLLHLLKTGSPTTPEGLSELLRASGLTGLWEDRFGEIGPIAPDGRAEVEHIWREATLSKIRQRLESASLQELTESRDLIQLYFPIFQSVAILASRWAKLPNAFGLVSLIDEELIESRLATWIPFGLLLLPLARSEGARDLLSRMRQSGAYFNQLAQWVVLVPADVLPALLSGDNGAEPTIRQQARCDSAFGGCAGEPCRWSAPRR